MVYKLIFLLVLIHSSFNTPINNIFRKRSVQTKDKFCLITLHDSNSSYDKNFIDAFNEIGTELGVDVEIKSGVPEGEECYNAAKEFAESGCKGIFADSFGHEEYILRAAKEYPKIQFAHATGTLAHTEKLDNFHNVFAKIYEARYVTGIAAGMKLNEMIKNNEIKESEAKIGYVGAFPYAEVISGFTAFYLGAKSVCNSTTMKVRYTGSWYDEKLEKEAAEKLIDDDKCKIISQHADSQGAPNVCESKGVPNVYYNGENTQLTKSYLISQKINYKPFFKIFVEKTQKGTKMDYDYTGSLNDDSVIVYKASSIAASGTQAAVDKAIEDLKSNKTKVFDTSKFTVNGTKLTSYKADVDTDENFEKDTEAISDGYFHESELRSAPYFDIIIDGIDSTIEEEKEEEEEEEGGNNNGTINFYRKEKNKVSTGVILAILIPCAVVLIAATIIGVILSRRASAPVSDPSESTIQAMKI
jgi:basic membrane protein A